MTDIVERLRNHITAQEWPTLQDRAADEITRLREENARLRRLLVEAQDYIDDVYDPLYISIGQELESLNIAAAIWEGEGKCR